MRHITDGPDIPEEVAYALRQNKLVLFCGSGISAKNGLPVLKGLIENICQELNIPLKKNPLLKEAWERKAYDSILDMIEGNEEFSVSRESLRKAVIKILSRHTNNTDIHKALLDLSVLPGKKGYRLVTTNFDRLFFKAGLKPELSDSAPKLAPPRHETWKNLTFLHGVIDKSYDPSGDNLVLTKRDFGLAYLQDTWAARFVIQLFQDFTVLFVGYGVNDHVMHYLISITSHKHQRKNNKHHSEDIDTQSTMTDKKEIKPSIYAFAGYKEGEKDKTKNKWKSIGVEPISYNIKNNNNHSLLYDTIKQWAKLKTDGLAGEKKWLKKLVSTPYKETQDKDKEKAKNFISAIKNKKLAQYFSEINLSSDPKKHQPVDISWLKAFSEKNSLLKKLFSPTCHVSHHLSWEPLSNMEQCMMCWLMHHLDKKELIHQVITECSHSQTGVIFLHPEFKYSIKQKLENISDNKSPQLNKRASLFWKVITAQDTSSEVLTFFNGLSLIRDLNKNYSLSKIKELFYWLKPQIGFKTHIPYTFSLPGEPEHIAEDPIYKPELTVNMDSHPSPSVSLTNEKALLLHAENWTNLLKDAMDLAKWVGLIDKNEHDHFFVQRPSIAPHNQNKTFYPWTYLIDLTRDSFDLAIKKDKKLARALLNRWICYPYSLFYRLIFYAVTKHSDILDENIAVDLLLKNKNILWFVSCENEVLRYLSGRQHTPQAAKQLVSLIIKGPPHDLYSRVDEKTFTELKERDIYQKLNRVKSSGTKLPEGIEKYYNSIQSKYKLPKKADDTDNFPFFHTGVRRSGFENYYHNKTDGQIFNDIKQNNDYHIVNNRSVINKQGNFGNFLQDYPERAFKVLSLFSDNDKKSVPYWNIFISEISIMTDAKKSNELFLKTFEKTEDFNDSFFKGCLGSLILMLDIKGGLIYFKDKQRFRKWWERLWHLSVKECEKTPPSEFTALNSHLGRLSHCIFKALWNSMPDQKITKNGKIPEDIKNYFQNIISQGSNKEPSVLYHFGHNLWQLWFLDKEWTIKHIKPLMDWHKQPENVCKLLWKGFVYNPSYSPDFLFDFKKEFIQMFENYKKLLDSNNGSVGNISDLFFIATGGKDIAATFTEQESKKLIQKMGADVFESLARKIWILLKDVEKGKSATLWSNKIKPWIKTFWPKQKNKQTSEIAEKFSLAVLYCETKFPEALNTLKDSIEVVIKPNPYIYIVDHICELDFNDPSGQNKSSQKKPNDFSPQVKLWKIFDYPKELLTLLNWNFPSNNIGSYHNKKIEKILNKLKEKHPQTENHTEYQKLKKKLT